jgi:hypothetical protein
MGGLHAAESGGGGVTSPSSSSSFSSSSPLLVVSGSKGVSSPYALAAIGGHKMHIFTANIPIFNSRYRRYVLITNEFHEFC